MMYIGQVNPGNTDAIAQAFALSSGTLSYLIDDTSHDVIDAIQTMFVLWLIEQPKTYRNRHEAWADFWPRPS